MFRLSALLAALVVIASPAAAEVAMGISFDSSDVVDAMTSSQLAGSSIGTGPKARRSGFDL